MRAVMTTGTPATPGALSEPVKWRRSVDQLTEEQLQRLRGAFQRAMDIKDDRGYWGHAGVHGLPLPDHCRVAHGTELFLPWHRAYLYRFELALQDRGDRGVTLPWWDWTSAASQADGGRIPRAYSVRRPQGKANPLYSAEVNPVALDQWRRQSPPPPFTYARRTERFPGQASRLPTAEHVRQILAIDDFRQFSGALEEIHGWVHVWVGGERGHMGNVPFAAFDPIFWAHHTMIDRLWRLWQRRHPQAVLPAGFHTRALRPFELTVGQVLDVGPLGYDYASATTKVSV
jgi:tyrosinase